MQHLIEERRERASVRGFGEVGPPPRRKQPLNLPRRGVGTQDDHRRLSQPGIAVQLTQYLFARDIRQVQVQQNQVRPVLLRQREAEPPLHRGNELDSWPQGERALHQAKVRQVVLDVEHGAVPLGGSGEHRRARLGPSQTRSEEHTSELQSLAYLVCRLLLEKKKKTQRPPPTQA